MSDRDGQVKMWPETIRLFRLHWNEWLKWAVLFFIIIIPLDIWISQTSADMKQVLMAVFSGDKEALKNPPPTPPGHYVDSFGMMLVGFVQVYILSVIFLKQESALGPPKISFGGFFYYLWKIFLWWLLLIGLFILLLIPLMIVLVVAMMATHGKDNPLFVPLVFVFFIPCMCYLMLRYALVFPLAACRVQAPIKTAVAAIRGSMWRVFLNILSLWLLTGVFTPVNMVLLPKIAVLLHPSAPENAGGIPVAVVSVIVLGLIQVVIAGISAAFTCAVIAILVHEKQATDPAFKLVTSV
jgi:hypothetical protein